VRHFFAFTAVILACQPTPAVSAPAAAKHPTAPPAAVPVRAVPELPNDAAPDSELGTVPDAGLPTTLAPSGPEGGPPVEAGSLPSIEVETPYRLWERPRERGDVYAAGRDEELARWNVGGTRDPAFISSRPGYHPGARVRVDAETIGARLPERVPRDRRTGRPLRVLTANALQAHLRKYGYWPYRLCFEEGLRKDQTLKGETLVRADVDSTGRIVSTRLLGTKLSIPNVAECLSRKTLALQVPPPGRALRVKVAIKLWPGDAPVPSIGPPDGIALENTGKVDIASVRTATSAATGDIAACYAAALERDAGLWGRIELRVDLDERGRARKVAENESRFPAREVVSCAVGALQRVAFPQPSNGALTVIYAIRLGQPPESASPAPATAPAEASPAKSAVTGDNN
jgi:hypothetical protein